MAEDFVRVSLKTLAGGAAVKQFDEALSEIYANILDPDTEPEQKRVIKLTLKLFPDDKRERVKYVFDIDKKIAPCRAVDAVMYVGHEDGELIAREQNVEQLNLFNKPRIVKLDTED